MLTFLRSATSRALVAAAHAREMRRADLLPQSPSLWGLSRDPAGGLLWDGADLSELADRFGTPLHVVNRARLEQDYRSFRDAFASRYPNVDIAYSYKTNPLPGVLKVLHACGATAEVISEFELWLALRLGVPGAKIVFNGPAKTRDALELAMKEGVKLINLDNLTELELLDDIANRAQRRQKVGLRVVTSVGWSGQFGTPIASGAAMAAFRRLQESKFLVPCGIHVHLGNGLRDTEIYAKATRDVTAFMAALRAELGIEIKYLDLGGGFGVPTVRPFRDFDHRYAANALPVRPPQQGEAPSVVEFAEAITALLKSNIGHGPPELILEPGRAITSSAQLLLLRVIAIKPGDAIGPHVILDGGKNIAMPPGWEYHEAFVVNTDGDRPLRSYSVYGPLCHTGDVMFRNRKLPELRRGDTIAIMDAGAYFVPNQMNFSNPRPAVVLISNGKASLIRARESFEDMIRLDAVAALDDNRTRESVCDP